MSLSLPRSSSFPAPLLQEALRLIRVATQTAAIDPRTGQIDMARLTTGHSGDEGEAVDRLVGQLREKLGARARGEVLTVGQIVKDLVMMGGGDDYGSGVAAAVSAEDVLDALRALEGEDPPIVRLSGTSRVTILA